MEKSDGQARSRGKKKRAQRRRRERLVGGAGGAVFVWRRFGALLGLALMVYASGALLWLLTVEPDLVPMPFRGLFQAVVIDAGHGGRDRGASAHGLREKDLTLEVAERLARRLERRGWEVVMTRRDDRYVALPERVRLAAGERRAVIFISVHFNYADNPNASGFETFYYEGREEGSAGLMGEWGAGVGEVPESERLARAIQGALVRRLRGVDRGVKNRGFYVLRHLQMPAVLVEGGFVSNAIEAKLLGQSLYLEEIAEAIEAGLLDYRDELRRLHHERRESPAI